MATKKQSPSSKSAKSNDPLQAIGDKARELEHEISRAVRSELKKLRQALGGLQDDVQKALDRVDSTVRPKSAAKGKAKAKPAAKKPAAKKSAAKKSPAKKPATKKPVAKKATKKATTKNSASK